MGKKQSYPYAGTKVEVEDSISDIRAILKKYGIEGVQVSELWSQNIIEVSFPVFFTWEGIKKGVTVTMKPPIFMARHRTYDSRRGSHTVIAPDFKAAMRHLYARIKVKLEEVEYGGTTIEKEFLSEVVVSLPDGTKRSLVDVLAQRIVMGDLSKLAIEDKKAAIPMDDKQVIVDVIDVEGR